MTKLLAFCTAALCMGAFSFELHADTPLRDPLIPDGETAIYRIREGDKEWRFTERVTVSSEGGRDIYGIAYQSEGQTTEVKIRKNTMIPFSVFTVTQKDGMTFESSTRVSLNSEVQSEDIVVLSFTELKYSLRGFPFSDGPADLGISFLESSDEDDSQPSFEIKVRYLEREKIAIGGRTIECHKLELKMRASGLMRVINSLMPKTYYWYSAQAPHYLVAYEGSSGFPGSAKSYVEIADYSDWE
jgi:hypothetical protein